MNDQKNTMIQWAHQAVNTQEVQDVARILAKHGLGICIVHMHDHLTGAAIPLPSGTIACERDLRISFERASNLESHMEPVAWRWTPNGIEVCASCCGAPSGPE